MFHGVRVNKEQIVCRSEDRVLLDAVPGCACLGKLMEACSSTRPSSVLSPVFRSIVIMESEQVN